MKSIILVALALVAIAVAAPATPAEQQQQPIKIIRSEFEQQAEGGYAYGFETENGITRQETGEVKEVLDEENKPHKVVIARGSYSYTNPDGKLETIEYVADEDGFRPLGDSIPKGPARR